MKNRFKIAAFAFAMFGFSVVSNAQDSDVATATADVVTPISIVRDVHMNFGRVAGHAVNTSTVTLGTNGSVAPSADATIIAGGSPAAAQFTVTGQDGYTYAITLPITAHELSDGATTPNKMTVSSFTSLPATSGTLTGGSEILKVGATLNIGINQPAGIYSSTSGTGFTVEVNYN